MSTSKEYTDPVNRNFDLGEINPSYGPASQTIAKSYERALTETISGDQALYGDMSIGGLFKTLLGKGQ